MFILQVLSFNSRTPADNWSAPNLRNKASWSTDTAEEATMGNLLKGLENIWAAPTPVDEV